MTPMLDRETELEEVIPTDDQIVQGWRTVYQRNDAGDMEAVEMPLYARDILHPQLGDEIMYADAHQEVFTYLRDVAKDRTAGMPGMLVLTDTGVNLNLEGIATISPDLAVIPNVRERKNWSTFSCQDEGTKPTLIIEITSRHRWQNDTEDKYAYYYAAGILCYVIVDLAHADANGVSPLFGYEWTDTGYRRMSPDARGRLWLSAIRVWLGASPYGVVCYDENDVLIPDFVGERKARREADETARKEAAARQAAEAQLQQLQAELARLRGGAK